MPLSPLPAPVAASLARAVRGIAEAEVAEELDRNDLLGVPGIEETAHVLQARLKKAGTAWLPQHADAIAHLRVLRANNQWLSLWN